MWDIRSISDVPRRYAATQAIADSLVSFTSGRRMSEWETVQAFEQTACRKIYPLCALVLVVSSGTRSREEQKPIRPRHRVSCIRFQAMPQFISSWVRRRSRTLKTLFFSLEYFSSWSEKEDNDYGHWGCRIKLCGWKGERAVSKAILRKVE